jgi:hypothetical protein
MADDKGIGIELPSDGNDGKQQVGKLETRSSDDTQLWKTATLTSSVSSITVTVGRRYYLKSDVDYHIETRLNGTPTDPTTSAPLVESGERLPAYFPAGTVLKFIKASGASDGNVWLVPN